MMELGRQSHIFRHLDVELGIDPATKDEPALTMSSSASTIYSSVRLAAKTVEVEEHALRDFLIFAQDVTEIVQHHIHYYVEPLKVKVSQGNCARGNVHLRETLVF